MHTVLFNRVTDISIIEGVRKQDDKTLNWLYDNYLSAVKKHVINNSGSLEDVSDVFQDTIIVLYNQIIEDSLDLTTDLKGYFFGIARNVWNAQLRRKQKTVGLEIDLPEDDGLEELADPTLEKIVTRVFQKLKPDEQMVLRLFSEEKSYEEIAVTMNLNSEAYARRKKYLSKETLLELLKNDPEYQEFLRLR
jgi:RNA polymerase sigma factor (sigma-70 family)